MPATARQVTRAAAGARICGPGATGAAVAVTQALTTRCRPLADDRGPLAAAGGHGHRGPGQA
ncbi:hypothetical protein [Streptomyces sp. NPDC094021]|uniref:hypothetical protein n=1 Tax=Streptomyces sp. NPDC094021 TaxID=3366054 RepID=UPI0037FDC9EB